MVVRDEHGNFAYIKCDSERCEARSPDTPHKGLINLGWQVDDGKHLCPVHKAKT